MNIKSKYVVQIISVFTAAIILTSWTIHYNYRNVFSFDGIPVHQKWPYIRMAIQISILTFFVGTTMGLLKRVYFLESRENENLSTIILIILFSMAIGMMLITLYYPGLYQLGLAFDSHSSPSFSAIGIIQTIFFYLILKQTLREKISFGLYFILLLVGIAIIFISPFFSGSGYRFWE